MLFAGSDIFCRAFCSLGYTAVALDVNAWPCKDLGFSVVLRVLQGRPGFAHQSSSPGYLVSAFAL